VTVLVGSEENLTVESPYNGYVYVINKDCRRFYNI